MTKEHKLSWSCPQCKSKLPKQDNTNTPVRQMIPTAETISLGEEREIDNITNRRKLHSKLYVDDSSILEDTLPGGETIIADNTADTNNNVLLKEIRELKAQITQQSHKQDTRDKELTETVKLLQIAVLNMTNQYTDMEKKNRILQTTIEENSLRMSVLEKEHKQLRENFEKLKEEHSEKSYVTSMTGNKTFREEANVDLNMRKKSITLENQSMTDIDQNKCLVLYGLNEYRHESELELHERVISVFYDIAGIDLTGYIEDLCRIGRQGYRRPLKIELLSKRITKYVLQSVYNFKNTGLWLSTFLDDKGLQKRRQDREKRQQRKSLPNYVHLYPRRASQGHTLDKTIPQQKGNSNQNNDSFRH
jgi:hypothetical protein